MSAYLAYVDQPIAYQLATGLIGSEVAVAKQQGYTAGINFKVMFSASTAQVDTTTTRTENLLPEVLMDALYEGTPNRTDTLASIWPRLLAGSPNVFRPGTPLLLTAATLATATDVTEADTMLAGEKCEIVAINTGERTIRGYVNEAHAASVSAFFGEPIEILGVLRYAAPYKVPGAAALNLGLRVVGVWLR